MPQKIELGKPEQQKVEIGGGEAGFLDRAGASIKISPQGKREFLEERFGRGNVVALGDSVFGDLFVRDPENPDKWIPFDEEGVTIKDLADLTGGALTVAPMFLAGSNPVTSVAGT